MSEESVLLSPFNPADWYWQVAGRSDFWSSAAAAYVGALPEGQTYTPISTEAELSDVLRPYGLRGPFIASEDVNAERDGRIATLFSFSGVAYQLDPASQQNIIAKGAQAKFAVMNGAAAGDLRWANAAADFGWIATDNSITPMDAPTMSAFADAADLWVSAHIMAAHAIKALDPIPADFDANSRWPTVI
jgi:hypothetical protein